jgi:N-acetylmuramoyl-L-alanine amidase
MPIMLIFIYRIFLISFLVLSLAACARTRLQPIPPPLQQAPYKPLIIKESAKPDQKIIPEKEKEEKPIVAEIIESSSNKKNVIVLDPGHGGEDYGTHSTTKPRYQEKYLNLTTTMLLKSYLEQMGYHIILTRKSDVFISLEQRAEFANKKNPQLFVSIHYNSAPSKEAEGIEIYYYPSVEDKQRMNESKKLAQSILTKVVDQTQAKSRGIKNGNFAVIRETKMPAVLIEGGFLTNESEMEKIKNPLYLKKIAWGIATGIDDYLSPSKIRK